MKRFTSLLLLLFSVSFIAHSDIPSIKFGIIGDYGDDSVAENQVADTLKSKGPEFIITLGDNNYYYGCWYSIDTHIGKYYADYIGNYKGTYGKGAITNRFFPSIGNHDWAAQSHCLYNGTLPYLNYFTLPNNGLYYDFVKGPIHFFVLDSDDHEPDGNQVGSTQYQWFKKKVTESKSCYKLVYFHHAPYSSAWHGDNKKMQWDFDKLGVDVVLSGHDHSYERILQDKLVYFVNGVGGAELSYFIHNAKGSQFKYNKHHGFMMASTSDKGIHFKFYNDKNKLIDEYKLQKTC